MSGVSLMRSSSRLNLKKIQPILNKIVLRKGSHGPPHSGVYRAEAPPGYYGPQIRIMKSMQIIMWSWIFYNFWYDPEIILGHATFQFPKAELWTDEDLGIPPDDYDEVV